MNTAHLNDQKILEGLGERFKATRLSQNITMSELAETAGISGRTVDHLGKWEQKRGAVKRHCRTAGLG